MRTRNAIQVSYKLCAKFIQTLCKTCNVSSSHKCNTTAASRTVGGHYDNEFAFASSSVLGRQTEFKSNAPRKKFTGCPLNTNLVIPELRSVENSLMMPEQGRVQGGPHLFW